MDLRFSRRELIDFGVAWLALSVAFSLLLTDLSGLQTAAPGGDPFAPLFDALVGPTMAISLVAVGTAFVLHELAHKVVAVRYGQLAEFRASYEMLVFAILSALAGFLVAAPGAVHHRGRLTARQRGLIAAAGPVTNLLLLAPFLAVSALDGLAGAIGRVGVLANALLAAFNLLPYGPLDGATVRAWSGLVHGTLLALSLGIAVLVLFGPVP